MNKKGFTLIEVLAAIILIAVALIPIMTIVPQMIENSLNTEKLTKVIFLAEKMMEETKRDAINDYDNFDGNASATKFDPSEDYKYKVSDDRGSGIRVIQIEVWHDEDGNNAADSGEQSITLNTKIADRG